MRFSSKWFYLFVIVAALSCLHTGAAANGAPIITREAPASKAQIRLSFAPVVKKTTPAVVNIYTSRVVEGRTTPFMNDPFFAPFFNDFGFGRRARREVENSLGSGFIAKDSGLIVTNAHVIENAQEISVILQDGREFDAKEVLTDKASDIALLQIQDLGDEALPHLRLHASENLEVGDLVLAIGNPFGVGQSVTSGIVSALARSTTDINDYNFFIQTDAAINPGNSGGPLVDLDGMVVGLNTAIYSRDGGSLGIGFAIPSEMVAAVIHSYESGHSGKNGLIKPWSGFTGQTLDADMAASLGIDRPAGVLVQSLYPGSPAAKAGLKQGDLITTLNGQAIRDAAELNFRLATMRINSDISLGILRRDRVQDVTFKLITPPEIPLRDERLLDGNHPFSGASIANISPAIIQEMSLAPSTEGGAIITSVKRRSVANRLGFRRGDIIRDINGQRLQSTLDIDRYLRDAGGRGWSITIERDGRIRNIYFR